MPAGNSSNRGVVPAVQDTRGEQVINAGDRWTISSHQPDLLPYSGFWYKVAKSDVFDIKIYDQFVDRGYQRRVKMRDKWATIPIAHGAYQSPIVEARIDPVQAREVLRDHVVGRYQSARYWPTASPAIMDLIDSLHTDKLWVFNHELILGVRDILGITTPISIAVPTVGRKNEGLISVLNRYPGKKVYLSGTGAKAYMSDSLDQYAAADIEVEFSKHRPVTGDSILTVLFDYKDPMQVVLAESPDDVPVHIPEGVSV
jgi:hypothetical protein